MRNYYEFELVVSCCLKVYSRCNLNLTISYDPALKEI